jgi:nicotinamidase-related amidase
MPITQLDPIAALIVVDLQKGIVGIPAAHPSSDIISRSAQLAEAFRDRSLPVVLVNVGGAPPGRTDAGRPSFILTPDWAELVPELKPQPADILIGKKCTGAFTGTTLHQQLQGLGVTQVFLTGISTTVGVESTARHARDLGYNVVLITDAMTDRDPENHRHSVEKIFPRLGETGTTADVLKLLQG